MNIPKSYSWNSLMLALLSKSLKLYKPLADEGFIIMGEGKGCKFSAWGANNEGARFNFWICKSGNQIKLLILKPVHITHQNAQVSGFALRYLIHNLQPKYVDFKTRI